MTKRKKGWSWPKVLGSLYYLAYALVIFCLMIWDLGTFLFISLFTLGLPLVFAALPLVGGYMFRAKRSWSILLNYGLSLIVLIFLRLARTHFPLRRTITEAGHYVSLSPALSILIMASFVLFLIVATVSMLYCLTTYKERSQISIEQNRKDSYAGITRS